MRIIKAIITTIIMIVIVVPLCQSQDIAAHKRDSTFLNHANTYINKKLGSEFVRENLKFLHLYHQGRSVAVYETTTTKNAEGRNAMIIYFKNMTYEVDTVLSVLSKDETMKGIRGDSNCKLYIGIEKTAEIAKKSGLKEGVKPWSISMNTVLPGHPLQWSVGATYSSSDSGYGHGAEANINMIDGKCEIGLWYSEP
jgi:hypothetical protein